MSIKLNYRLNIKSKKRALISYYWKQNSAINIKYIYVNKKKKIRLDVREFAIFHL